MTNLFTHVFQAIIFKYCYVHCAVLVGSLKTRSNTRRINAGKHHPAHVDMGQRTQNGEEGCWLRRMW